MKQLCDDLGPQGTATSDVKFFRSKSDNALTEGAIWDRKTARHESAVEIIKCVTSRIGTRYLVQGLESGRQRFVNHSTLLRSYEPRR